MSKQSKIRVKRIRAVSGINIRQTVVTGIDTIKDKVEMYLTGTGVMVSVGEPFSDKFIPFANIYEVDLIDRIED